MSQNETARWPERLVGFMWNKALKSIAESWTDNNGRTGYDILRRKWGEVPLDSQARAHSSELAQLDDEALHMLWVRSFKDQTVGKGWGHRGWYYALYRDQFRGKRILDFGSGLGFDAITFMEAGANVTCADVAEDNLSVIQRIARIRGLGNLSTLVLEDFSFGAGLGTFDVIWCCGSMIHSPFSFIQRECSELLKHLPVGGRWIELGYPEARWVREGKLPFELWGERTDGGAPWAEWKDLAKLQRQLAPAQFEPILNMNFRDDSFNWFDLVRRT